MPLQILGHRRLLPFASTEALMFLHLQALLGWASALNHIEEAFGRLFRLDGMPDEYLQLDTDELLCARAFKEMIDGLVARH